MSITVLDHCPGCGKCARPGVCSTGAITIEDSKALIGQGCIDCGLCIPICPIGLIVTSAEQAPVVAIEENQDTHVLEEDLNEGGEADHGETSTGS